MGKKSRLKRERKDGQVERADVPIWIDDHGAHAIGVGQPPSVLETAAMTEAYQQRIRNSPLWDQMVKEFGEQKAAEMLKEFKVKIE
jgi:hypothetical protein